MRHLYYFYSCFNPTFMGGLLDEAIELSKDKENEVLFVYCGGVSEMCQFNLGASASLCRYCSKCTKKVIESYGVKCESLKKYEISGKDDLNFDYSNAEELRSIKYRNVNIGLGIISGYISATRNLTPLIDEESRKYFDAHLAQNVRMVDAIYNLIDKFNPDAFHFFNGRYEEVRPIWDICHTTGLKCYIYEGTRKDGKWKKLIFEDHLPHDIKNGLRRRQYVWDHYNMSEEEKIAFGKSFYERRRNGLYAGDKIYIKDQKKGNIPPIDESRINIGIMNSSEDEFCAVGAEWDSLKFFPTQYEGIVFMLEHADPKVYFYLRIHPNLKNIKYKYYTDLLTLGEKYLNITVIPADSDVSTYDLLDHMDKIVCFGSTMGMESSYWKVPTINLGPAMYSYDDICYEPNDNDDLLRLLVTPLEAKFNDNLYKYGAYSLDKSPLFVSDKNLDYQLTEKKFMGYTYHIAPFISYIINDKVTGFIMAVRRYLLGRKKNNKYQVPLKEA